MYSSVAVCATWASLRTLGNQGKMIMLTDEPAGPSGLGLAVGLARQGISFRIIGESSGIVDALKPSHD